MIRRDLHPLFIDDVDRIESHIFEVSGDARAALSRVREIDALVKDILSNPTSGVRLDGSLSGHLVRHGGRDHKITIVFRPFPDEGRVRFLIAAFGGQNWSVSATQRM